MDKLLIIGGVILFLIIVYFLITFNRFTKMNNRVKEAFATMDVYLKKRWDLIPNLVESVKGYAKHEKNTLTEIINLRKGNYDSLSTDDKVKVNKNINQAVSKLMLLVESYPEIKANENFLALSKDLSKVEDEIANSRKYFNAVVRDYNNVVELFPRNIVAIILGYKSKEMFSADDSEKDVVKVDL